MTRVSFGMINRDGAETIADCLRSVAHLVDEMIVVDTGSSDDSPAIARSLGATVIHREWPDDYAAARNFYLEAARCPFVLSLDSDEVFPACTREELEPWLSPRFALLFTVHNYFRLGDYDRTLSPSELVSCSIEGLGISRSQTIRLFPRARGVRYRFPIHELVWPSLHERGVRVRHAPWPIHHLGFVTGRKRVPQKRSYYRRLGERKIAEYPDHHRGYFELAKLVMSDGEIEEAQALLDRCIALAPKFVDAYREAALLALRQDDLDRCSRYLAKAPSDELDLVYVGALVAMRKGERERAIAAFSKVLEETPKHFPSRLHLADLLVESGEPARAEAVLRPILEEQPGRADVRLRLAEIAEKLGDSARAEEILRDALGHPEAARELKSAAAAIRAEEPRRLERRA